MALTCHNNCLTKGLESLDESPDFHYSKGEPSLGDGGFFILVEVFLSVMQRLRMLFAQRRGTPRGQSFVELALVLPVLLILLLGVVEVAVFIGRYLDLLDLTREAARWASMRDPFSTHYVGARSCSNSEYYDFYYLTACNFSPPQGSDLCTDAAFCNGMNFSLPLDPDTDDVVISVFTVSGNTVTNVWPSSNGWSLYGNWQKDCQGNVVRTHPHFTRDVVQNLLSGSSTPNKGFVAVEVYYCYEQILKIPIFTQFVPDPFQINAFTIMPLPAAQPTPTSGGS